MTENAANKKTQNVFKAILLASFIPALVISVYSWGLFLFPYVFVTALAHVIILGLPVYFLMKKFDLINWYYCAIAGFLAGGLIPMISIISSFIYERRLDGDIVNQLMLMGGMGAIGGVSGWFGLTIGKGKN